MIYKFVTRCLGDVKTMSKLAKNIKKMAYNVKNERYFSVESKERSVKLLVIGGGTGGCSISAKLTSKLGKNNVVIVEPSDVHYYQPMFTLIGGGIKKLEDSRKSMGSVLPKNAEWIKDSVQRIEPQGNFVTTQNGMKINYEFLVVAAGLKTDYTKIPRFIRCIKHARKWSLFELFAGLRWENNGKRGKARLMYHTSLSKLFGVEKYSDSLWKICKTRGIEVTLNSNLIGIEPDRKIAYFENLDSSTYTETPVPYSVLHVTPPMGPPQFLRCSPMICDTAGFLDVDSNTLRHKFFRNIFGIGDCANLPTSKTAAAIASQCGVLYDNLLLAMSDPDQAPTSFYNGYTSCPLITGYNKCILAEFDYSMQPLETFPIDQSKESFLMFFLKKNIMPLLYWHLMLRGYWNGPETMRRVFHMDFKEKKSVNAQVSS
ncbi:sulfide:quinone oxidoreductase, putative [Pediculus humanus corporis]|uniref:Sulfide:quinone oxidoreductase, putative n=1 Tax=Pediculus humanus subsp. corporis TaxID=121224 RepID=E0V9C6_PEDHC|nr:sulfide:quinone oxidoreductase, putative [Pediculus humanus corporis]EEB09982.1 sulfide:quinone oxidoreductase, putative [Pediculus humanus corporis]